MDIFRARAFFRNVKTELVLVLLISFSVLVALWSLVADLLFLEVANYFFSFLFCFELTVRFLVRSSTKRYWKTFWLDWIASIPWDLGLLFLLPAAASSLVLARILRVPRLFRLFRFFSLSRSNVFLRISYQFKKQLEKSLFRQLFILALVSFAFVIVFALAFSLINGSELGESFYFSFITLISSDSIFEVDDETALYKALTVFLAFIGIIIFNGILIAVVVSRITEYLDNVREGRGDVREKGHLLILGWHPFMPYFFQELEIYGRTEEVKTNLVLLVPEIQESILASFGQYQWLEISVRKGLPYRRQDLDAVSISEASRVLVLGDPSLSAYEQESVLIKSYLTLDAVSQQAKQFRPQIMLAMREGLRQRYLADFSLKQAKTTDLFFYSAKILVSTLSEPLIYQAFHELLSFEGSEFHFIKADRVLSYPLGQLHRSLRNCLVLGLEHEGQLCMLPDLHATAQEGDRILVLSESTQAAEKAIKKLSLSSLQDEVRAAPFVFQKEGEQPEGFFTAIIGVNSKLPFILDELDKLNCPILVIDNQDKNEFEKWYYEETGVEINSAIEFNRCDFKSMQEVQGVLPLDRLDRVVVLADESGPDDDPGRVDADTLFKILRIRALKQQIYKDSNFMLLAEILSPDSQEAVQLIPQVSFVMGPLILGKLMTMLVTEPQTETVLRSLVQRGGIDLDIQSWDNGFEIRFHELYAESVCEGFAVIGYVRNNKLFINPAAETRIFPDDRLLVLKQNKDIPCLV